MPTCCLWTRERCRPIPDHHDVLPVNSEHAFCFCSKLRVEVKIRTTQRYLASSTHVSASETWTAANDRLEWTALYCSHLTKCSAMKSCEQVNLVRACIREKQEEKEEGGGGGGGEGGGRGRGEGEGEALQSIYLNF